MPRITVWTFATLLALAILTLALLYPLSSLFAASVTSPETGRFSMAGYAEFFATDDHVTALINTLILAFVTTIGAVVLGVTMAFVIARYDFPLKSMIGLLPLATLVIPDIIVCQAWIMVFGNNGFVTNWVWDSFGLIMPQFYGWTGLVFVMILQHYAYIYLMVFAAFQSIDGSLEQAAQNLGSSPWRTYRTVTIPVLAPAVLVSAMVVFSLAIDNFGIPAIIAPRVPILSVAAYNTFISELGSDPVMQSTMSVMLVVIATIVLVVQKLYVERRVYQMEAGKAPEMVKLTGLRGRLTSAATLGFILATLLPVLIILVAAFTHSRGPVLHWGQFSLVNLERAITFTPEALYNSLFLAGIATVVGTAFSVIVSYILVKKRSLLTNLLDFVCVLPLVIAGTVLGIAMINAYNAGAVVLTGTWFIMAMAYFVRRVPYGIRTMSGPIHSIKDSLEEASINLGVSPLRSFAKVILPIMTPAILSGAIFMWVTTLSELSATIVLYSAGLSTMPIQIFTQLTSGYTGPAAAYSAILMVSIFIPLVIAIRVFKIDLFGTAK
ncbi:MAG: iron ABC transporter permease [Paracoccaceae bacterium]|nr:iron ABC transporter permease [Paracoccaceae bacterium]